MKTRTHMKIAAAILLLVWSAITLFIPAPVDIPTLARFVQSRIASYTLCAVFLIMWYIDAGKDNEDNN